MDRDRSDVARIALCTACVPCRLPTISAAFESELPAPPNLPAAAPTKSSSSASPSTSHATKRQNLSPPAASIWAKARPQELWTKAAEVIWSGDGPPPRWHLIGHLQRNKVRRTLPLAELIHSVDSLRLLTEIDAEAAAIAETGDNFLLPVRLLLEVKTSGEEAKQGLAPDDVESMLAAAAQFPNVHICGLMTMAALEGGQAVAAQELRHAPRASRPSEVHRVHQRQARRAFDGYERRF